MKIDAAARASNISLSLHTLYASSTDFFCVRMCWFPHLRLKSGPTCSTNCMTSWSLPSILPLLSSPPLPHWPQALTPHFMGHGPPPFFYYPLVRVCACVWMMRNTQTDGCNLIARHLERSALTLFSLRECEWQTGEHTWSPAVPDARTNSHIPPVMPLLMLQTRAASLLAVSFTGLWSVNSCTLLRQIEALSLVSRWAGWMFYSTRG